MAIVPRIRRNSLEKVRLIDNDDNEFKFICDCNFRFPNEKSLLVHQKGECRNRRVKCSFCSEYFPSTIALGEHFMLCGNKTDRCPICNKYIRRAQFAYHYENNCVHVADTENNQRPVRLSPPQRNFANQNQPLARVDIPYNRNNGIRNHQLGAAYREHDFGSNSLPRKNSMILVCRRCQQKFSQEEYSTHSENCPGNQLNNRREIMARPQSRNVSHAARNDTTNQNGIVQIPCEFCNKNIDLPTWSRHTQECREREERRIENLKKAISREPVTELIPCEFCHKTFSGKNLHAHQFDCQQNSAARRGRMLNERNSQNRRSKSALPDRRVPKIDDRLAHYHIIDIDRTRAANHHGRILRRSASDDLLLHSINSSPASRYGADSSLHNNNPDQRVRAVQNPRLIHKSTDQRNETNDRALIRRVKSDTYLPFDSISEDKSSRVKIIDNNQHQPVSKKKAKKSLFRQLCGCGGSQTVDD